MLLVFGCIGTDFCKKICVLQHFSKSTRLSSWNFWNLAKFCKFLQILRHLQFFCWNFTKIAVFSNRFFCENFEIAAVQKDANLVELEKCCQTHIFLQNFVLIQPRTSPPKICKILLISPICYFGIDHRGTGLPFFEKAFFENAFFENFANFWRARSRLYQNEILQENMRSTAFFKLYKICILLHRCNLKILAKKSVWKNSHFREISASFNSRFPLSSPIVLSETMFSNS